MSLYRVISFQIISYNKSRYLINAVESILDSCPEEYEITIYEGHPDEKNKQEFMDWLEMNDRGNIEYLADGSNLGYCRAYNWISEEKMSPKADVMIQLSEDMFFGQYTITNLLYVIRHCPHVGIVSADAAPTMFDRFNPQLSDVQKFRDAFREPQRPSFIYGSGFPFCMKVETWNKLKNIDVWDDGRCLPYNDYKGAFDEAIDPSPMGWASDWDLIARLKPLGLRKAVLDREWIYHYDHVSGNELDVKHN